MKTTKQTKATMTPEALALRESMIKNTGGLISYWADDRAKDIKKRSKEKKRFPVDFARRKYKAWDGFCHAPGDGPVYRTPCGH